MIRLELPSVADDLDRIDPRTTSLHLIVRDDVADGKMRASLNNLARYRELRAIGQGTPAGRHRAVDPDRQPAPARNAHRHDCGDWCFCYAPSYDVCEKCRRKAARKRMADEYAQREGESGAQSKPGKDRTLLPDSASVGSNEGALRSASRP